MSSSKRTVSGGAGVDGLKPWKVLESHEIFVADPWIKLSVDRLVLPDGKLIDDYYQIKLQDYAVIFAETAQDSVLALRMYKHGVGRVCMVLPAGAVEEGEVPLVAAQRELLEETGYCSDDWGLLGSFVVNGNYGCGQAHLFVARNARRIAEPDSGDLETMEVMLMQPAEIQDALRRGDMAGLGTVAAIALAMNPVFGDYGYERKRRGRG